MNYYSVIIQNEVVRIVGKCIKLGTIFLNEIAQTIKEMSHFLPFADVSFESLDMCVLFEIPIEVSKLLKTMWRELSKQAR